MDKNIEWFKTFKNSHIFAGLKKHPIAYFCAEFALDPNLPTYAGGLGVLAADIVREAYDREIPMVAIGIYYHKGYIGGRSFPKKSGMDLMYPETLGLEPLTDKHGERIIIKVPIQDSDVSAQVWVWQKGTVPVYLLDTNIGSNSREDQLITENLYDSELEIRLKQEILLGVGGYRLLKKLDIDPSIYHMNEGHSALLSFMVASEIMHTHGVGFLQARDIAKKKIVFTNHTLVAAGHDNFTDDLSSVFFNKLSEEINIPVTELIGSGLVRNSEIFSMTMLALRSAGAINAVSELHSIKAKEIWKHHPMQKVTNGIHLPTWDKVGSKESLWVEHQANKKELIGYINKNAKKKWKENELMIGWARRVVTYKRPLALFRDMKRIKSILNSAKRPVRLVFAGLYHPQDQEGKNAVEQIKLFAKKDLKENLVFLDDYSTELGALLTSGCDVWLNTPVVGFEACGTSGMKAALNGALNFSTKDGWLYETDLDKIGWEIDEQFLSNDIYETLEKRIIPEYYFDGIPSKEWREKMLEARKTVQKEFSATKMMRVYCEEIYSKLI